MALRWVRAKVRVRVRVRVRGGVAYPTHEDVGGGRIDTPVCTVKNARESETCEGVCIGGWVGCVGYWVG